MGRADLERLNVLQNYPSGLMSLEGVADLTVRLTEFGRRFLAWITLAGGARLVTVRFPEPKVRDDTVGQR